MPKYRIECESVQRFYLVVEAPSPEACEAYQERWPDQASFKPGPEDSWRYIETSEVHSDVVADVQLDERGDPLRCKRTLDMFER